MNAAGTRMFTGCERSHDGAPFGRVPDSPTAGDCSLLTRTVKFVWLPAATVIAPLGRQKKEPVLGSASPICAARGVDVCVLDALHSEL